jgi:hypothetical protein
MWIFDADRNEGKKNNENIKYILGMAENNKAINRRDKLIDAIMNEDRELWWTEHYTSIEEEKEKI